MSESGVSAVGTAFPDSGAISTDILEFRARVLVIQASRDGYGRAALISDTVLPVYSGARAIRLSRAVASRRTGPRSFWWSALGGHAAASIDGHVSQVADRLASTRVRRAAAARAVRSAGTASPCAEDMMKRLASFVRW